MTGPHPALAGSPLNVAMGECKTSRTGQSLTTVLGTCVAVTLYDPVTHVGGLNHYMLADCDTPIEAETAGRYGRHAMTILLYAVTRLGARVENLQAKVFGGGVRPFAGRIQEQITARNVDVAMVFLAQHRIPVIASDTGGEVARRIIFDTATGRVLVKRFGWGCQGGDR